MRIYAEPIWQSKPFTQEEHREQCHEDDAELVDRSNARGIPELQGAEVANPGSARRRTDRIRNNHVLADTVDGRCQLPKAQTISAATNRITAVRTGVAKSELTFSMPTFAKIAVRAANPAESSAQNTQESDKFFI